jgi:hypothetical protein
MPVSLIIVIKELLIEIEDKDRYAFGLKYII